MYSMLVILTVEYSKRYRGNMLWFCKSAQCLIQAERRTQRHTMKTLANLFRCHNGINLPRFSLCAFVYSKRYNYCAKKKGDIIFYIPKQAWNILVHVYKEHKKSSADWFEFGTVATSQ